MIIMRDKNILKNIQKSWHWRITDLKNSKADLIKQNKELIKSDRDHLKLSSQWNKYKRKWRKPRGFFFFMNSGLSFWQWQSCKCYILIFFLLPYFSFPTKAFLSLRNLWNKVKKTNTYIVGGPEKEREKEKWVESLCKEITAQKFLNLGKLRTSKWKNPIRLPIGRTQGNQHADTV